MEDQQSDSGDLSSPRRHRMPVGKARRGLSESDAPVVVPGVEGEDENASGESELAQTEPAVESQAESGGTVVFAERRPAGRRAPAVIGIAAALFVAAGAFAGATVAPYVADRAAVATKLDIARTAAEAITTLWTYTPENMEQLGDRAAGYLGGDFAHQYRQYIDAIAPTNKQAQVSNNTQVVGAAVEALHGADATAIVYTNTTSTSPLTKNVPSLRYLSYRLELTHRDAKWLVTKMSTITSLDLTPQM